MLTPRKCAIAGGKVPKSVMAVIASRERRIE